MNPAPRGFTLLELLVALAVFSILSIAAYSGLRNVLFTRAAVEAQSQRLAAVQLAVFRLEQDIEQAAPRSIRDEYGDLQAALLGSELSDDRLTLTRAGWDNPLGQPRANVQRVAYRLREGRLWRLHWPVLDQGGRIEPRETLLLDRVRARIGDAMALHSDAGALLEVAVPPRADIRLAAERPAITALVLGRATLTQSLRSGAVELAGTTAALRRGLLGFEYFVSALLRIDAADELRRELEI